MEITIRINKAEVMDWINGDADWDNIDGGLYDDRIEDLANQYADFIEEETGYKVGWGDISGHSIEIHGQEPGDEVNEDMINAIIEAAMAKAANWEWAD